LEELIIIQLAQAMIVFYIIFVSAG
jgi:hypothetical protein